MVFEVIKEGKKKPTLLKVSGNWDYRDGLYYTDSEVCKKVTTKTEKYI